MDATPRPIVERKQKPGGAVRDYPCILVYDARPALMVVRFVMERGGAIFGTPVEVPPGSISDGFFWARRPYNLYRMYRTDGSLIAHRLDAVADVVLTDGAVTYRDLFLDWWVYPDGTIVEEDRDELARLAAVGLVTPADVAAANAAAHQVLGRYRHVIDEAEALERVFGRGEGG